MADVFISYARVDRRFIDRLRTALIERGQEVWRDTEGIYPADRWWPAIQEAIERSEVILVVLSEAWLRSTFCQKELASSVSLNKRIIPVSIEALAETTDVPRPVAELNWITVRPHDDLGAGVEQLIRALNTDLDDARIHTRTLVRAKAWERGARRSGALLRGDELRRAEDWLSRPTSPEPAPTELHREFVSASRAATTRRQYRATVISLTVAGASIALAAFAVTQRNEARKQRDGAISRQLAADALGDLQNGVLDRGVLLSIEAYRAAPTVEAGAALVHSAQAMQDRIGYLRGHSGPVAAVAFSPDGTALASAGADGRVIIWSATTGRLRRVLRVPGGDLSSLAFSSDGKFLAAGSLGGAVLRWDATAWRSLSQVNAGTAVYSVALSPNGRTLAAGTGSGVVVWDAEAGTRRRLRGTSSYALAVAFSPNGAMLASGGLDGMVTVSSTATWRPLRSLRGKQIEVNGIAFSPDSQALASAGNDRKVLLWDPTTGKIIRRLLGHADSVRAVAFSNVGSLIASVSDDHTVMLWNARTGRVIRALRGHQLPASSVAFSPDGSRLASGSDDYTVILWSDAAGQPVRTLRGHAGQVSSVAYSPDGATIASAGADGRVLLWSAAAGKAIPTGIRGKTSVNAVAYSPNGRTLAFGGDAGTVTLWNVPTGRPSRVLNTGPVDALAFSPDAKVVAAAGAGETISLWDAQKGTRLGGTIRASAYRVTFAPDGHAIATADNDVGLGLNQVDILDARTGYRLRTLKGHLGFVEGIAFAPDGETLASAGNDGTVILWDPHTGQRLLTLRAPGLSSVDSVGFSPDGRTLASGSADGNTVLWDAGTGQPVLTQRDHTGPVRSLAFAPDGRTLATAGDDHTIVLLESLPSTTEVARTYQLLCDAVRRSLTPREWRRFLPGTDYRKTCSAWP